MVRETGGGVDPPLHPVLDLQIRRSGELRVSEVEAVPRHEGCAHTRAVRVDAAARVAVAVKHRAVRVPGPADAQKVRDLLRGGAVTLRRAYLVESQHGVAAESGVHRADGGAAFDPPVEELAHRVVSSRLDEAECQHSVRPPETETAVPAGMAVQLVKEHPLRLVRHGGEQFFVDHIPFPAVGKVPAYAAPTSDLLSFRPRDATRRGVPEIF